MCLYSRKEDTGRLPRMNMNHVLRIQSSRISWVKIIVAKHGVQVSRHSSSIVQTKRLAEGRNGYNGCSGMQPLSLSACRNLLLKIQFYTQVSVDKKEK